MWELSWPLAWQLHDYFWFKICVFILYYISPWFGHTWDNSQTLHSDLSVVYFLPKLVIPCNKMFTAYHQKIFKQCNTEKVVNIVCFYLYFEQLWFCWTFWVRILLMKQFERTSNLIFNEIIYAWGETELLVVIAIVIFLFWNLFFLLKY